MNFIPNPGTGLSSEPEHGTSDADNPVSQEESNPLKAEPQSQAVEITQVESKEGEWEFTAVIYGWGAGAQGVVDSDAGTSRINESFSDLLEFMDLGAVGFLEGRKGQWGFLLDAQYMRLEGEDDSAGVDVEFDAETTFFEAAATFSPLTAPTLQFLAGVRLFDISTEIRVPGILKDDDSTTVVDPIIGAMGTWQLSEDWLFRLRGDFGGFGASSELTYQGAAVFRKELYKGLGVSFGFRIIGWDIDKSGVETDLRMSGPLFGADYMF